MKLPMTVILALSLMTATSFAQFVSPTQRNIKPLPIGGNTSGGATISPKADPKIRYTSHFVLLPSRQWTSTDGKAIEGILIAFEDIVVVGVEGSPQPATPEPPAHPTVVRDGKIRLIVNKKAIEVPIARFSPEDQALIEHTRLAHIP